MGQGSYSEEVWGSSFSKNKAVLKRLQHMLEGKSLFIKKIPNETSDYVINWNYFSRDVPPHFDKF